MCTRKKSCAHLGPVQGQPLGGAAVVVAGLGERRPQWRAGRVVQDLLLRGRNPPLAQNLAGPQASVTAAAALGPLARQPAMKHRNGFLKKILVLTFFDRGGAF